MTSQEIAAFKNKMPPADFDGYRFGQIHAQLEIAYQLAVANERAAEGNTHAYELGARHEREKAASAKLGIFRHPFTPKPNPTGAPEAEYGGYCSHPGCGETETHPIHGG